MMWQPQALQFNQWMQIMPKDADGNIIDWRWIQSLDLEDGIGEASAVLSEDTSAQPDDVHDALQEDLSIRERLESVIAQCSTAFMCDFDRIVTSYALPRALAYANRRLNDEIRLLVDLGERMGLWSASTEKQGRSFVTVLSEGDGRVELDDVQDRTGDIVEARAAQRDNKRATRQTSSSQPKSDWRDVYLPGRDVDTVLGIDIETTGTDPARDYIIDVGFEYMNMISPVPVNRKFYQYEQAYYVSGDAYGQARLDFGVTENNAELENEVIANLTGIDVRTRSVADGYRLFDEWIDAQHALLMRLTACPYVAHNARFEHGYFMLNVTGYAEAYRAGHITIIDTLPMSRRWDPGSAPDSEHPYGNNTLDAYAKRQGALDASHSERHLGLEDAHIMLVAMKHHLAELKHEGRGPWGPDGRSGVGGKSCGRHY